jgi:hypothetical protein
MISCGIDVDVYPGRCAGHSVELTGKRSTRLLGRELCRNSRVEIARECGEIKGGTRESWTRGGAGRLRRRPGRSAGYRLDYVSLGGGRARRESACNPAA